LLEPVAVPVHGQDMNMVGEPVERRAVFMAGVLERIGIRLKADIQESATFFDNWAISAARPMTSPHRAISNTGCPILI
jgi:hypothetical protein